MFSDVLHVLTERDPYLVTDSSIVGFNIWTSQCGHLAGLNEPPNGLKGTQDEISCAWNLVELLLQTSVDQRALSL